MSTRWSATRRAASRYFFTRAGDMASDSAELSNPASLAGSTGNSCVGRMSTPGQVADGVVVLGVAHACAGTGPGSPAFRVASSLRTSPIQATHPHWRLGRRLRLDLGRRHRAGLELLQHQLPASQVLGHGPDAREAAQVHVALGLVGAVTAQAIRLQKRPDGLVEACLDGYPRSLRRAAPVTGVRPEADQR